LRRARAFLAALAAVVVVGAALRAPLVTAWASTYPLSQVFNGEEVETVRVATGMLHKHTLNPHQFGYPSLYYYLGLGTIAALEPAGPERWSRDLVAMRCLSLAFGLGTLVLIGLLARRIGGDAAGVLAASLAACDRTLIDVSTIAKPNSAQLFFFALGLVAVLSFAARPRLPSAAFAALAFGLAAASKWLGILGLAALPVAGLLAGDAQAAPAGAPRLWASIRGALGARTRVWTPFVPLAVFGAVFFASVPYALLSPREFGFGFAQTFIAQGAHQLHAAWWTPFAFLLRALGPVGLLLSAGGGVWALARLARWDGSAEDRGVTVMLWWALKYGALVLFVFVQLPSYLDLWAPGLTVLAGGAWSGTGGWLPSPRLRWACAAVALVAGVVWSGGYAVGRVTAARADPHVVAGHALESMASPRDTVLADLGAFVPETFHVVRWNSWGSPPRIVYDESATWGTDPAWPDWIGGHRRLVFENAKWQPASTLLAARPNWVVTTDEWQRVRAQPSSPSESADPDFDRSLADGRAGYRLRLVVGPSGPTSTAGDLGVLPANAGPVIRIFQRIR
jgi:hypothetical protein